MHGCGLRAVIWASLGFVALTLGAAEPRPRQPDPDRAFGYLQELCKLGPRYSGSPGMDAQQQLIARHFAKFPCKLSYQSFDHPHPLSGVPVRMNNIVISWQPEATERVLLACHYDTRPLPDMDPNPAQARQGRFLGANDGASGVALFMELAHHLAELNPRYGVDFVLFDGEELIYGNRGEFFAGSIHFATEYKQHPPAHRYLACVLVDMIGDRNLAIYQERNSLKHAPRLVESVWAAAARAGVKEFIPKPRHEVRDDHLPLNEIAAIPAIDLIDFDYPHWHTSKDVPAQCSGASLAKVGTVLLEWLHTLPELPLR
jgi:glutaminyl-peptide cyclotransferase